MIETCCFELRPMYIKPILRRTFFRCGLLVITVLLLLDISVGQKSAFAPYIAAFRSSGKCAKPKPFVPFVEPQSLPTRKKCVNAGSRMRTREPEHLSGMRLFAMSHDEITCHPTTQHTVSLPKPLGLILDEVDESKPTAGVIVASIVLQGAAATDCSQRANETDVVCINDRIVAVNGVLCAGEGGESCDTIEEVIDKIHQANSTSVDLTVGRPSDSVVIRWPNGSCVAAKPGTVMGEAAALSGMYITYSCRNGGCGTCEQAVVFEKRKAERDGDSDDEGLTRRMRYIRPCVARVPKNMRSMTVLPIKNHLA